MADSEHLSRDVTEDAVPFTASDLVRELPATSASPETVGPAESDDDIETHKHKFPKNLRIDIFDAMILYQDNSKTDVQKFLEQIKAGMLSSNGGTPSILLYDEILPERGMSPVEMVDLALPRCTYVFLYITEDFFEDNLFHYSSNTCIMNSILKPNQMWSVVPIFTESKWHTTYDIPPSVMALKGIQYESQSTFDVAPVVRMFKHSLNTRLQNEKELKQKRLDWIRKGNEKKDEEMRGMLKQVDTLKIKKDKKHPRESQLRTSEEAHKTDTQHVMQLSGNTKSAGQTSRSSVQTSVPAIYEGSDHNVDLVSVTGSEYAIGSAVNVYIAENIYLRQRNFEIQKSSDGPNTSRKMPYEEHTSGETPSVDDKEEDVATTHTGVPVADPVPPVRHNQRKDTAAMNPSPQARNQENQAPNPGSQGSQEAEIFDVASSSSGGGATAYPAPCGTTKNRIATLKSLQDKNQEPAFCPFVTGGRSMVADRATGGSVSPNPDDVTSSRELRAILAEKRQKECDN